MVGPSLKGTLSADEVYRAFFMRIGISLVPMFASIPPSVQWRNLSPDGGGGVFV